MVYGRTLLRAFTYYDPRSSSWRTLPRSGAEDLQEYSATWPRAGMTVSGRAYERVTLALHTGESESSFLDMTRHQELRTYSLLPTPCASESHGGQSVAKRIAQGHQVRLSDVVTTLYLESQLKQTQHLVLLPTPLASNGTKGSSGQRYRNSGLTLPSAVIELATKQAA